MLPECSFRFEPPSLQRARRPSLDRRHNGHGPSSARSVQLSRLPAHPPGWRPAPLRRGSRHTGESLQAAQGPAPQSLVACGGGERLPVGARPQRHGQPGRHRLAANTGACAACCRQMPAAPTLLRSSRHPGAGRSLRRRSGRTGKRPGPKRARRTSTQGTYQEDGERFERIAVTAASHRGQVAVPGPGAAGASRGKMVAKKFRSTFSNCSGGTSSLGSLGWLGRFHLAPL